MMRFENLTFSSALNLLQSIINDTTQHTKDLLIKRDTNAIYKSVTIGVASYLVSSLLCKSFNYVFNGPVRQLISWQLSAGSRRAFAKQITQERDNHLRGLTDWAQSDKNGCPAPTFAQRRETTELSIAELRSQMIAKKLSPVFLLKCAILNTADAQKLTNCISVLVVGEDDDQNGPIKLAVAAEKAYAEGNIDEKELPLLGIPMSIKDCLHVKGTYSTAGCMCFASEGKATYSGGMAQMLRSAGAIIFCKTNVPQTMLSYDCENKVFGTTGNAYKPTHSPGGSSGGECALVALRGSIAGIGTDIGGSNRIPNIFNGVLGLRPSLYRCPNFGTAVPTPGQESISSTPGPVGKSVSDLKDVFRAMVAEYACKIDGVVNCIPFRDDMYNQYATKKTLKIGFYTDDGWLVCSPACRRAVLESVDKLKAAGHEIVEFSPSTIIEAMFMFYKFVAADGCDTVCTRFDGFEPPMKAVLVTYLKGRVMPTWFFEKLIPFFASFKSKLLATGLAGVKFMNAAEFFAAIAKRNDLRHEFARAISAFDCVICPAFVIPAPKIGATADKPFGVSYTAAINVLDQSSIVMPTTVVDAKKDTWDKAEVVKNNSAQKESFDLMDQKMRSIYDAKEMEGLPVGIQILTPRTSEERCLGCAEQIEKVLGVFNKTTKPPSLN